MSSIDPFIETTTRLGELTTVELGRARTAAEYLLGGQVGARIIDTTLLARLASLLEDLKAEQAERRELAHQ